MKKFLAIAITIASASCFAKPMPLFDTGLQAGEIRIVDGVSITSIHNVILIGQCKLGTCSGDIANLALDSI
jgi:hypothetical protein